MRKGALSPELSAEVISFNMEIYNTYRKSVGLSQVRNDPKSAASMLAHLKNNQERWTSLGAWIDAGGAVHDTLKKDGSTVQHYSALVPGTRDIHAGSDPFYAVCKLLADFGHRESILRGATDTRAKQPVGMSMAFNGAYWAFGVKFDALRDTTSNVNATPVVAPQGREVGVRYSRGDSPVVMSGDLNLYGMPVSVFFNDLDGSQISDMDIRLYEMLPKRKRRRKKQVAREVPLFVSWKPLKEAQAEAGALGMWPGWEWANGYGAIPGEHLKWEIEYLIKVSYTLTMDEKKKPLSVDREAHFSTAERPKRY